MDFDQSVYDSDNARSGRKPCGVCGDLITDVTRLTPPDRKYCGAACQAESLRISNAGGKFLIFNRDGLCCMYCGHSAPDGALLVLDHITPVASGGTDTAGNLATSCRSCNLSKHAAPLSAASESVVRSTVDRRNREQGVPPDKPIKGSHCRVSTPRSEAL